MANRAQQPPSANPDAAAAALGRMQLGDRGPASAPAVPRMPPGRPGVGGLKRNKPGFKLSDITGDDTSSAANAGLGAGAPSLARQEWQPRKPVAGTPFANFRKIVCVLYSCSRLFLDLFPSHPREYGVRLCQPETDSPRRPKAGKSCGSYSTLR